MSLVKNTGKKAYISGPITGIKKGNFEAFQKAEDFLKECQLIPVNPHKIHGKIKKRWRGYMIVDIKKLVDCEHIYILDGYTMSKGAMVEIFIAQSLGIKAFRISIDPLTKAMFVYKYDTIIEVNEKE